MATSSARRTTEAPKEKSPGSASNMVAHVTGISAPS